MAGSENEQLGKANHCLQKGDTQQAREICKAVLRRNNRSLPALEILAAASFQDALYDDARMFLNRCRKLKPREGRYLVRLSQIEQKQGRFAEALAAVKKAKEIDPGENIPPAWLASLHFSLGQIKEAETVIRNEIRRSGTTDAFLNNELARILLKQERYEELFRAVEPFEDDESVPIDIRRQLHFTKADALHRLVETTKAFAEYKKANSLTDINFDPDEYLQSITDIQEVFNKETMKRFPRASGSTEIAVFIVGMPRSGTTLIEQIINAHPQAAGGGEMPDLTRIVRKLPRETGSAQDFPMCVTDLTQETVNRLSDEYLQRLRRVSRRARRVVNKNLDSHLYIGLIALLFPEAKIVHARRDPMDTCFSCYTMHLLPGNQPWACDLSHLGIVYRSTERLIEYWKKTTDLPILDIRYEDLVNDPEKQSRSLIEFLGLDWDEKCLRYYESGKGAATLSREQVSRPIYSSSLGRHKPYLEYLQPLIDALKG